MKIETVRRVLLWCAVINYGILLVWFLVFMLAHDWMYQFHGRWFHLSVEQFDMLHYAGMSIFKLGIIMLNLVPYIALHTCQYLSGEYAGANQTRKLRLRSTPVIHGSFLPHQFKLKRLYATLR